MTYSPVWVTKTEIRNYFDPTLSTDDLNDTALESRIELMERWAESVYEPSDGDSTKVAIILLVVARILEEDVGEEYKSKVSEAIGDYKVSYDVSEMSSPNSMRKVAKNILSRKVHDDKQPFTIRKV